MSGSGDQSIGIWRDGQKLKMLQAKQVPMADLVEEPVDGQNVAYDAYLGPLVFFGILISIPKWIVRF